MSFFIKGFEAIGSGIEKGAIGVANGVDKTAVGIAKTVSAVGEGVAARRCVFNGGSDGIRKGQLQNIGKACVEECGRRPAGDGIRPF